MLKKPTYLIVGLGNPDKQYLDTFHNVGFMCLDAVAAKLNLSFLKGECRAVTATKTTANNKIVLAKPVTYMNLSGFAVAELVRKYKIEADKCLIVYDDVDLPLGEVRIRLKGSGGTHNGMRNVVDLMHTQDIYRLRIGINRPHEGELYSYVLSHLTQTDRSALDAAFDRASDACIDFANGLPLEKVMQKYN